jgi:predicted nuclease of restriction endonuclease-like (RecB) superfamily
MRRVYQNNRIGKVRGKTLWENFNKEWVRRSSLMEREVAINPFWPEREKVQYETYKDELASRDPTSLDFLEMYRPYVDPSNPEKLVDPPKRAQKYLIEENRVRPMNNAELKAEIKRLQKVLEIAN